jgi:hypothetical protein
MPWLYSNTGEQVLVDQDIFDECRNYVWRSLKKRLVFYRRFEGRAPDGTTYRKRILLHRQIVDAGGEQSVHHINGLWDCRRQSLKAYNSFEEHHEAEHRKGN